MRSMPDLIAGCREPAPTDVDERLERLFDRQVLATPDASAIEHEGATLAYAELDRLSNGIARHLAEHGVGRGAITGIYLERTPLMIAALLGVLRTGSAYLPLDRAYPADRNAFMLTDSGATAVITHDGLPSDLPFSGTVIALGEEASAWNAPTFEADDELSGDDLAYVIYTSGSTGKPKGVMLAHSGSGLVAWLRNAFAPADIARIAASTSICFDPSIIEVFATLGTGGTVVLKRDALEPFAPDEAPTMMAVPPRILIELLKLGAIPESVRVINTGGEVVSRGLIERLYRETRVQRVYNHYGPTEATTCATVELASPDSAEDPAIGRPIAGARVYVLDEAGRPVPNGGIGELHIAGRTVARGYLNRPIETAARFLSDPFVPGDRMYATGDLGRMDDDGRLWFHGRRDSQVKLHGYRIELGEVEAALARLPGVTDAVALVRPDGEGRERLHGFLVADRRLALPDVRRELATWLPLHMLPTRIVVLDGFPRSPTGKVDRAALIAMPCAGEGEGGSEVVAESTGAGSMIEGIIAQTIADRLGLARIGPEDDFYAFGGDSLSAIDVALRLEELLGKPVAPALMAHETTPRAIARALEEESVGDADVLSGLQGAGDGPILFCTPELYGRPLSYVSLARHLAPDYRLMGLGLGPFAARPSEIGSMRAISLVYRDAVRACQPAGPYIISGYSFGAAPAYDLAQLLREEGERVLLVLIDGPIVRRPPSLGHVWRWLKHEAPAALRDRGLVQTARDLWGSRPLWTRILRNPSRACTAGDVPRFVPKADRATARLLMEAVFSYAPEPYDGPAILIRSTRPHATLHLADDDGWLGWRDLLTGDARQLFVAGSHAEIMRSPGLVEVSQAIEAAIAETLSA